MAPRIHGYFHDMKFKQPLLEGVLLKRYKRFFADLKAGDKTIFAHVANSGSMKGCSTPESKCRYVDHGETERKLKYTLEMVQTPETWIGVNTSRPNALIYEAWADKLFSHWKKYDRAQREVKISNESRIDLVLWKNKDFSEDRIQKYNFETSKPKFHLVEIKNVSLAENGVAMFPDSVTERGQKHLRELMKLQSYGHTTEIVFVIQREDCKEFISADDIDPEYGKLLRHSKKAGVIISPYACKLSVHGIEIIPVKLPYSSNGRGDV